ncbi:hypothetical protein KIN20_016709 [Parelaphostrongylus tenuis]|uniref:Uncharacterized protein n=1 Tax=Parelaphostrongylus tenuis TaxID=148309 RepID=A0AAD5MGU0_PARTN|nr:hypothetical protein KIN20_016709 [Parelaphostrongylus tenuis]
MSSVRSLDSHTGGTLLVNDDDDIGIGCGGMAGVDGVEETEV